MAVPKPASRDDTTAGLAVPAEVLAAAAGGATEIGGYRIAGKLGEGGMGIVYEAEQTSPRRAVALKVMRSAVQLDEGNVRLFRRESEALARLRHRGIAAIYEAGTSARGEHFFAMELVRGVPLRTYLRGGERQAPPPLEERLRVFLSACEAVAYAHQNGVLHRDLKPSNILVTGPEPAATGPPAPAVKVLDFGLARFLDDGGEATALTTHGQLRGTLGYMSPEQVRGDHAHVGPRSDVYSLGVILYEVVTGRLPYEAHWARLPEAVRVIAEEPPVAPARAWEARHGRGSRLDRDLETIILKALEKDPARRYTSATALADDVSRHLDRRPILARPPSAAYQLRKLVARHRAAAALLSLLFVVALGFAVTMAVQSRRLARERDAAARERATAERVTAFMVQLFRISNPGEARGSTVTAREILDRGAERIAAELEDQPEVKARLLDTMAEVYRSLGLFGRSVDLRRQGLAVRRSALGPEHPDVGIAANFLADALRYEGRYAEAEPLFVESIALLRRALGPDHAEIARALNNYALLLYDRDQAAAAVPLHRESLAMRRKVLGDRSPEVANGLNNLGLALQASGATGEALPMFRESVDIRTRLLGADHLLTWNSRHNLAVALGEAGQDGEARSILEATLAARRRLLGETHPDLVTTLVSLGTALQRAGRLDDAQGRLEEAVAMARRLPAHPRLGRALHALGELRIARADAAGARAALEEAVALRRRLFGDGHSSVRQSLAAMETVPAPPAR